MASTIKVKRSSTASAVPSSLAEGELAANTADGKLFLGKNDSSVVEIGAGGGGGGAFNPVEAEMLMRQTSSSSAAAAASAEVTHPSQVKTIVLTRPSYVYGGGAPSFQEWGSGGIGGTIGPFGAMRLGSGNTDIYTFIMPADFTELVSADILTLGYSSGGAVNSNAQVWYGQTGSAMTTKSTSGTLTYVSVQNALKPLDISSLFTGVAAGNSVVINFESLTNYVYYCGIQISYK
jgi:hypothetical protein